MNDQAIAALEGEMQNHRRYCGMCGNNFGCTEMVTMKQRLAALQRGESEPGVRGGVLYVNEGTMAYINERGLAQQAVSLIAAMLQCDPANCRVEVFGAQEVPR